MQRPNKIGGYEFKEKLGNGTYGEVFRGVQEGTDKEVAIKEVQISRVGPKEREYLNQELALMQTIEHPNVVKLLDSFQKPATLFFILELCSGDLQQFLRLPNGKNRSLGEELAKDFMCQIGIFLQFFFECSFS